MFLCKCIAFAGHKVNIYTLYIFHFISYIERGEKSPLAPKIGINFKEFGIFYPKYLRGSWICRTFAVRYILKGGR